MLVASVIRVIGPRDRVVVGVDAPSDWKRYRNLSRSCRHCRTVSDCRELSRADPPWLAIDPRQWPQTLQ